MPSSSHNSFIEISYLKVIKHSEIWIASPKIENRSTSYQKHWHQHIHLLSHDSCNHEHFCHVTKRDSCLCTTAPVLWLSKCFIGLLYLSSSRFISEQLEFCPGKQTTVYTEERDMMIRPFRSLSCWKLWNYQKTVIMKMLN